MEQGGEDESRSENIGRARRRERRTVLGLDAERALRCRQRQTEQRRLWEHQARQDRRARHPCTARAIAPRPPPPPIASARLS